MAGSKLGVINHTLLTGEFLQSAGLQSLGVVLNHPLDDSSPAVQTNETVLRRLLNTRLFVVPRSTDDHPDRDEAVFRELAMHILTTMAK